MSVLQSRVTDAPAWQVPAATNCCDGFDRSEILLRQTIEGVTARSVGHYCRQLLYPEVLGLTLELHVRFRLITPERRRVGISCRAWRVSGGFVRYRNIPALQTHRDGGTVS